MYLMVFARSKIQPGDDEWFYNALNLVGDGTYLGYLKERYLGWTGRVVIEAIMVRIIHLNTWIWRILNSSMILLLVGGIYNLIPKIYLKNISERIKAIIVFCIGIFILIINKYVFHSGIAWITGSFNYIWPMTLGVICMIPFKKVLFEEKINYKLFFIYYLSCIMASNCEQVSLVILCFGILTNIFIYLYSKRKNIHLYILTIFMAINTSILFMAPGNYIRADIEAAHSYLGWEQVSLLEKLIRGSNLLVNHLIYKDLDYFKDSSVINR